MIFFFVSPVNVKDRCVLFPAVDCVDAAKTNACHPLYTISVLYVLCKWMQNF